MNEKFLYRAKCIDADRWVEGNLLIDTCGCFICADLCINNRKYKDRHYGYEIMEIRAFEIDPSTVCQCTGLMDKNGKLIYENDIVELYDRNIDFTWRAVLIFGNPCEYTWGCHLEPIGECNANEDILCWIDMEESGAFCEIIGNTFENPELLEVGE